MSLGLIDLEVLMKSGRPQDPIHASKIFPIVKNQHLLLCTLLIDNSLAMESLPIFLDKLVPSRGAILSSDRHPYVWRVFDWMLGKGHSVLFRRAELRTFVDFHGNEAGKGGYLTHDEPTIIAGALELTEKTAKDAMTPISKALSLNLDGTLNLDMLNAIITMGRSRISVYSGNPTNIVGLILVKNLLMFDPDEDVPIRRMMIRKIPRYA